METPTPSGCEVSWCRFDIPGAEGGELSDGIKLYLGTPLRIYESDFGESDWVDVSKGTANYAASNLSPGSWDYASWGSTVIATNFVDPVQFKESGDTEFSDMITSTEKPKARFVTVSGQQVILANLENSGGSVTVFPDSFWIGAFDDLSTFEISEATQSDIRRVITTPGEITGLVGFDNYFIVFKRQGIFRYDYVGPPLIYQRTTLSRTEGTAYPRSIVEDGNNVYFMGQGGLRLIANGQQVIPIGDTVVNKMLTDGLNENFAIKHSTSPRIFERESNVVGGRDFSSGLLVWLYNLKSLPSAEFGTLNGGIAFNPKENRFTRIEGLSQVGLPFDEQTDLFKSSYGIGGLFSLRSLRNELNPFVGGLLASRTGYRTDFNNYWLTHLCEFSIGSFDASGTNEATLRTSKILSETITGHSRQTINVQGIRLIGSREQELYLPPETQINVTVGTGFDGKNETVESRTIEDASSFDVVPFTLGGEWVQVEVVIPTTKDIIRELSDIQLFYEMQ
jgi:hypothetical protein